MEDESAYAVNKYTGVKPLKNQLALIDELSPIKMYNEFEETGFVQFDVTKQTKSSKSVRKPTSRKDTGLADFVAIFRKLHEAEYEMKEGNINLGSGSDFLESGNLVGYKLDKATRNVIPVHPVVPVDLKTGNRDESGVFLTNSKLVDFNFDYLFGGKTALEDEYVNSILKVMLGGSKRSAACFLPASVIMPSVVEDFGKNTKSKNLYFFGSMPSETADSDESPTFMFARQLNPALRLHFIKGKPPQEWAKYKVEKGSNYSGQVNEDINVGRYLLDNKAIEVRDGHIAIAPNNSGHFVMHTSNSGKASGGNLRGVIITGTLLTTSDDAQADAFRRINALSLSGIYPSRYFAPSFEKSAFSKHLPLYYDHDEIKIEIDANLDGELLDLIDNMVDQFNGDVTRFWTKKDSSYFTPLKKGMYPILMTDTTEGDELPYRYFASKDENAFVNIHSMLPLVVRKPAPVKTE